MKVIALDPGVTTGYATGIIEQGEPMGVLSGQAKWNEKDLYDNLVQGSPDIIIYEEFDHRPQRFYGKGDYYKVELFPRNLIGVINLYVQQQFLGICKVVTQKPAKALGGFYKSNDVLKEHGVYKVANPHANDAMRHLLTWYTFGSGFQYDTDKKGFRSLA
jgi:hypothetical protein